MRQSGNLVIKKTHKKIAQRRTKELNEKKSVKFSRESLNVLFFRKKLMKTARMSHSNKKNFIPN